MTVLGSPLKSELSALSTDGVDATGIGARARLLWVIVALLRGHVDLLVFVSANAKAVDASFGFSIACSRSSNFKFGLDIVISWVRRS